MNMRNVFFFLYLSFTSCLFQLSIAEAQNQGIYGGSGSFDMGMRAIDAGPLNDLAENMGYEETFSNWNLTIGGSGQSYVGRIVYGGGGAYVGQSSISNEDAELGFAGGKGQFFVGYSWFLADRIVVYPSIGAGFIGMSMSQQPKETNQTAQQVLNGEQDLERGRSLSYASWLGTLALNADLFPLRKEGAASGPMLGISAGYELASSGSMRDEYDNVPSNAPELDPGGLFIKVRLGGGFCTTDKEKAQKWD